MNKKQMVILWILGIWVSAVIVDVGVKEFFFYNYRHVSLLGDVTPLILPPLIIGGLLIYTLRTRK